MSTLHKKMKAQIKLHSSCSAQQPRQEIKHRQTVEEKVIKP
jgi:hypothetical protein